MLKDVMSKISTEHDDDNTTGAVTARRVLYGGECVGRLEGGDGSFKAYYINDCIYSKGVGDDGVRLDDKLYKTHAARALGVIAEHLAEYEHAKALLDF